MTCYVGLDVSIKETAICVVDEMGDRIWDGKLRTDPDVIAAVLARKAAGAVKIGIETGPMTVWLWHALTERELPVVCLHARHAAAALKLQMNKTDRNDAFGLAMLVRSGWYRPVAVRSMDTHRLRALLITRDQLAGMSNALINKIRDLAKTFGILVGPGKGGTFECQVRATLPDDPVVAALFESLLAMLATLRGRQHAIAKQLGRVARQSDACRLMMTMPGVGPLTAVSFMTTTPTGWKAPCSGGPMRPMYYIGATRHILPPSLSPSCHQRARPLQTLDVVTDTEWCAPHAAVA